MTSIKPGRLPTVVDVGAVAGVSRQTVSNVLNTPEIVAPATRAKVEDAIKLLGYRPHASARRLRTRKSSTIGIRLDPVQNGISGAVLDRFLHALTELADAQDLRILLFTAADPWDEIRHIKRLIDGADVDSFVLTSTSYEDPRIDWLVDHGVNFVTFGRPWGRNLSNPAYKWVDVDARFGVHEATSALLGEGAHRIAYLGWPPRSGSGDERRDGWREAMTAAGQIPLEELADLEAVSADSVAEASEAVRRLVSRHGAIDALVCASDTLALGATTTLEPHIPVIGFDDTPVSAALGFSSVKQPLKEVASAALELLSLHLSGVEQEGLPVRPPSTNALIRPTLIRRTGGSRASD